MEPFKNMINEKVALQMARAISRNYAQFDQKSFLKNIKKELEPKELKDRVRHLSLKLKTHLPEDQVKSLAIILGAIKQGEEDDIGLSGFSAWPLTEYISQYGIEHFDQSMKALKEITKVFTSEFGVRAFFIHDQDKALKYFNKWASDKNEHVRRWVSEGSRPLLPWGQKLHSFVADPILTWHLLDQLKNDQSEYVRKSVANHINDHSKNHPDFVIKKLSEWRKSHPEDKSIDWIIRHASRTLIKKGHKDAFHLHGVEASKIKVLYQKILKKKIKVGTALQVEVEIQNLGPKRAKVILDHEIHLLKSNHGHNIKCFKGKSVELDPEERVMLSFNIPFKVVTTRKYYSGKHFWNISVNGQSEEKLEFMLIT